MIDFIIIAQFMTEGAQKMAETDPQGWTMTLVAVSVVFSGLILLFGIYALSGAFFSGKFKRKEKSGSEIPVGEVAAAIAMALEAESGKETEVAICTALHLYLSECVHDAEPYKITLRENSSAWSDKALTFRKSIRKS